MDGIGRGSFRRVGAKVAALALAIALTGGSLAVAQSAPQGGLRATVAAGVQTIVTEVGPNSYPAFTVQAGIPLRWILRVRPGTLNGCNNAIVVPDWKLGKRLAVGDNLVEFTPGAAGQVRFSCWMGMIRSRITVVPDLAAAP